MMRTYICISILQLKGLTCFSRVAFLPGCSRTTQQPSLGHQQTKVSKKQMAAVVVVEGRERVWVCVCVGGGGGGEVEEVVLPVWIVQICNNLTVPVMGTLSVFILSRECIICLEELWQTFVFVRLFALV